MMISARYVLATRRRLEREMRASAYEGEYPDEAEFQRAVDDAVEFEVMDAEMDAARDRELFGVPEDTPSIQSADIWGTGEGQHHGLI